MKSLSGEGSLHPASTRVSLRESKTAMKTQDVLQQKTTLWVFGYGSLVWKPDFKYSRREVGHIRGYKRRFWHGDDFYRGDKEKLGRVVTLVEEEEACTWGVAYQVTDEQVEECLQYLNMREVLLGGYVVETVEFVPQEKRQDRIWAVIYIATSDSPNYLGPASEQEIAAQISTCRGATGHNMEYLLRLVEFMRRHCPEVHDAHLFSIEAALLNIFHGCGEIDPMGQNPVRTERFSETLHSG